MAPFSGFCGGFNTARSRNVAAQAAVNIYSESTEVEGAAKRRAIYGTPGTVARLTVATVSCRGWFSQDDRTLVVVGGSIYLVDTTTFTAVLLGTIADDGDPVSFASNGAGGEQIGIVGGGQLKVYDTGTATLSAAITLPFSGPVQIVFLDGYALINERNTPTIWFSALEDMTSWDALDFVARSGSSDHVIGIEVIRDRIWVFGSKTSTIFYDSGDADTPFLPYPGSTMPEGLANPWAKAKQGDTMYWLAQGATGTRRIVRATDPSPVPITPPPLALVLASAATLDGVEMLTHELEGHVFIALTCPTLGVGGQTWVYDVREQEWHQRGVWDSGQSEFLRWRARGCCVVAGRVWVGDYATGALSTLDLDVCTDRRVRRAPYLSDDDALVQIDAFELGIQSGVGTAAVPAPVVHLRISRDSGWTWESAGDVTLGRIGEYEARAVWTMLGQSRLDRLVFEVSQSDSVRCVWSAPWIKLRSGSRNR